MDRFRSAYSRFVQVHAARSRSIFPCSIGRGVFVENHQQAHLRFLQRAFLYHYIEFDTGTLAKSLLGPNLGPGPEYDLNIFFPNLPPMSPYIRRSPYYFVFRCVLLVLNDARFLSFPQTFPESGPCVPCPPPALFPPCFRLLWLAACPDPISSPSRFSSVSPSAVSLPRWGERRSP